MYTSLLLPGEKAPPSEWRGAELPGNTASVTKHQTYIVASRSLYLPAHVFPRCHPYVAGKKTERDLLNVAHRCI